MKMPLPDSLKTGGSGLATHHSSLSANPAWIRNCPHLIWIFACRLLHNCGSKTGPPWIYSWSADSFLMWTQRLEGFDRLPLFFIHDEGLVSMWSVTENPIPAVSEPLSRFFILQWSPCVEPQVRLIVLEELDQWTVVGPAEFLWPTFPIPKL